MSQPRRLSKGAGGPSRDTTEDCGPRPTWQNENLAWSGMQKLKKRKNDYLKVQFHNLIKYTFVFCLLIIWLIILWNFSFRMFSLTGCHMKFCIE